MSSFNPLQPKPKVKAKRAPQKPEANEKRLATWTIRNKKRLEQRAADLREAMYYGMDVFERARLVFFLDKETLRDAALDKLEHPPIFGTTDKDIHEHAMKYLRTINDNIKVVVGEGGVPVQVIIPFWSIPTKRSPFNITLNVYKREFANTNLDIVNFMHEMWHIPNPVTNYLPPPPQGGL